MRPVVGDDPIDPGVPATGTDTGTGNTRAWCAGAYYTGNYPSVAQFHEDRLIFAATPSAPQRVDMSNSGLYEIFSPSALKDGTVVDSNACAFTLSSNEANGIKWLVSDQNGLLIGTAGGEWLMRPAVNGGTITPTNVDAKQSSQHGSAAVTPLRVGNETMFVQSGGKRIRQMIYDYYVNGFQGADLSFRASHLTVSGFKQLAYQRTPQPIIWALRNDGLLISIPYDRSEQDKPQDCGWALHTIAGGIVQSIAVIPSVDGTRDEVWMAVQRTVNGATVCYTERMTKIWEEGDATAYDLEGTTEYRFTPVNTYYLDCAQRGTFGSPVTTVSGLGYLEGATVGVLADGATHPDCVVTGGSITLQRSAADVTVGLKYESRARTMTIEAGAAAGTAQTKKKKIHRVGFRLFDTLGMTVRPSGTGGQQDVTEPFRRTNDLMDAPPPLFSGDFDVDWEGTFETDGTIEFAQTDPLPFNISMLVASLETQDG
jgi:hypothetical protein